MLRKHDRIRQIIKKLLIVKMSSSSNGLRTLAAELFGSREVFLQNVLSESSLESRGPEPSYGVKLPSGQRPWPACGSPGNGRSPLPGIGVQAQSLDLHCGATLQVFLCGARHQLQPPASLTAKHALEFLENN